MPVTEETPLGEEVLEDIAILDVLEGTAAPEVLGDIEVLDIAVLKRQKTPVRTQTSSRSTTPLLTAARGVSILLALWLGGAALLGLGMLALYLLIWVSQAAL